MSYCVYVLNHTHKHLYQFSFAVIVNGHPSTFKMNFDTQSRLRKEEHKGEERGVRAETDGGEDVLFASK